MVIIVRLCPWGKVDIALLCSERCWAILNILQCVPKIFRCPGLQDYNYCKLSITDFWCMQTHIMKLHVLFQHCFVPLWQPVLVTFDLNNHLINWHSTFVLCWDRIAYTMYCVMLDIVLCLTLTQYKVFDTVFEHKGAMSALPLTKRGRRLAKLSRPPSTGRGKLPPQTRTAPRSSRLRRSM